LLRSLFEVETYFLYPSSQGYEYSDIPPLDLGSWISLRRYQEGIDAIKLMTQDSSQRFFESREYYNMCDWVPGLCAQIQPAHEHEPP
jgi:hypothetical protein